MEALEATPISNKRPIPPFASKGLSSARHMIDSNNDIWSERVIGRWRWRIHPDWLRVFDHETSPDWQDLDHDGRMELVKANDGRRVYKFQVDG